MRFLFFFILLSVPLFEIFLFAFIGGLFGGWSVFMVVVAGIFCGIWLLQWQSRQAMHAVGHREGFDGQSEITAIAHGGLRVMAAILIMLPGFATDFLGLCLLVPFVRRFVLETTILAILSHFIPSIIIDIGQRRTEHFAASKKNIIIEGEFEVENETTSPYMERREE